jgi:hypothetical protein
MDGASRERLGPASFAIAVVASMGLLAINVVFLASQFG